ncbi:MAG: coproporphyrinogen III oxidase, partial [Bacteroidota bacterium]|nr:coproporphyrinogen III oxidase [Bacteroidota bacterium]
MDHFALPGDKLFTAAANGNLHRNFMGYTTTQSKLIIGLGVSSISDAWTAFAQNEKEVEAYEALIAEGRFPLVHGHGLNEEDQVIRKNILELMCRNHTRLEAVVLPEAFINDAKRSLAMLEEDGLVVCNDADIQVTDKGRSFIRNISASIDTQLWRRKSNAQTFSKAI